MSIARSIAGVAVAALVSLPVAAAAQTYPPAVAGGGDERPSPPAQQGSAVAGVGEGRTLPVTGGDVVGMTAVGAGLVGAGAVLVRRSRKPATA